MLKEKKLLLFLALPLLIGLACGPASTALPSSPTASAAPALQSTPLTPNPLNVQITLDKAMAQTSTGMFYLQTASGASFATILPEDMANLNADGSLVPENGAAVTMTPVADIAGIPFSKGFLAAVDLAPQGMILIEPATITLTLPGEYDPATLVGFASEGNGNNFHLYPVKISAGLSMPGVSSGGTIVTFEILHFSMYGVAQGTSQEIQAQHTRVPEGDTAQNEDMLAPLVPLDQRTIDRFTFQHDTQVQPEIDRLVSMEGDCNHVDVAAQEFIVWHSAVAGRGAESYFTEEIARDTSVLLPRLIKCMEPLCSLCMKKPTGDKNSTDAFLVHAFYAEQISKIAGLPYERFRWWTLANQCAVNAGREKPHADTSTGCGNDCGGANGATPVPPVCPLTP